ncbi:MAG: metallophosphoesterase family protein [Myxococcaceae bacterium]
MAIKTLAHLSDLHLGLSPFHFRRARALCDTLLEQSVDHVVVTGDVTHKGREAELALFTDAFAPLLERGRVTVVPGNHDRIGEDIGSRLMSGLRVDVNQTSELYLVRVDSTASHNRSYFAPHGEVTERELVQISQALAAAPQDKLTAVLLHHHVLPMPEEGVGERFASAVGWPHASELALGATLVELARGRCDLILHGHRHVPAGQSDGEVMRPLGVYNGGASTELGRVRVFSHVRGRVLGEPRWLTLGEEVEPRPWLGAALEELRAVFA